MNYKTNDCFKLKPSMVSVEAVITGVINRSVRKVIG